MNIKIIEGPGNSAAVVSLLPNEKCTAEGGAMIAARGNVQLETTTQQKGKGGIMSGLKRLFGGESYFLNHFTAGSGGAEVTFATTLPGDMTVVDLAGPGAIVAEAGSFVVKGDNVTLNVGWQGMKSLFVGEGMFWLELSGSGPVVLSSFGAIYVVEVNGEYVVDTGHIVAFDESLTFKITKAGSSWTSSFLGGEGLVCHFSGKGRIWCQSHHAPEFGKIIGPLLRPRGEG